MSAENYRSVSYDEANPLEAGSHDLRKRLKEDRKLPVLWPIADREDGAGNVLVRLLKEAQTRGIDLLTLVRTDPDVVRKKLEAERSRVRREKAKLAKQMSEEMEEVLPAELALSEAESAELIEQVAKAAALSAKESRFIGLCVSLGQMDYDIFSEIMGVGKDELYRIAYKAKGKLGAVLPDIAESLLEHHDHPVQPSPDEAGVWKRFSGRVV
jgi:hypothetical protein